MERTGLDVGSEGEMEVKAWEVEVVERACIVICLRYACNVRCELASVTFFGGKIMGANLNGSREKRSCGFRRCHGVLGRN